MVTPTPTPLYFDAWAFSDKNGTALGELARTRNRMYSGAHSAMGSGAFEFNRTFADEFAWSATDNLVRVRRVAGGPFAYDDERYVGAFVITEGADTIVAIPGQEWYRIQGLTPEILLKEAVVDYVPHYADNLINGVWDTAAIDGQTHQYGSKHVATSFGTPGTVLRVHLRDWGAQVPEPIAYISHDFSTTNDSNGDPWTEGDADWDIDVGTDGLQLLDTVVAAGLFYKMHASLLLQAFEAEPGDDLSGSITLARADNIRDSVTREVHATPAKSWLLIEGSNKLGAKTYHWSHDDDIEDEIGVRQGFAQYAATSTPGRLEDFGQAQLKKLKAQRDGPPVLPVIEDAGRVAFVDYFPGDIVHVDAPEITGDLRIHSITLIGTDTAAAFPVVQFTAESFIDEPARIAAGKPMSETWHDFAGVLYDGADEVTADAIFVGGQYLAVVTSDGSYTMDVNGAISLADTSINFPNGAQWRVGFEGMGPIDPGDTTWRGNSEVGAWWAKETGAAPFGYDTGMVVVRGTRILFYNKDGTDLVNLDGAGGPGSWTGFTFYFTVRFHAQPNG